MKTLKKKGTAMPEEEEYKGYSELENELDRMPFDQVSARHNLLGRFNHEEYDLLWQLFVQANAVRFFVSAPRRTEQQVTREEAYFVTLRRQLFSTAGWNQLPVEIRKDIENHLLQGWE